MTAAWKWTTHHYDPPAGAEPITQTCWGRTTRIQPSSVEVHTWPNGNVWASVRGPIVRLSDGERSNRYGGVIFDAAPDPRQPERDPARAPEWLRDLLAAATEAVTS